MQCFSMQVVMTKCFLQNPGKKLAPIRLVFDKNAKTAKLRHTPISQKGRPRAEG